MGRRFPILLGSKDYDCLLQTLTDPGPGFGDHMASANKESLGAEPPTGSSGRAHGHGVNGPKTEIISALSQSEESANLSYIICFFCETKILGRLGGHGPNAHLHPPVAIHHAGTAAEEKIHNRTQHIPRSRAARYRERLQRQIVASLHRRLFRLDTTSHRHFSTNRHIRIT